jgi:hypothetical protein
VGKASSVSGTGPWTWSCSGSDGGRAASCSATKAAPPVAAAPSASGTTIPSASQIVDGSANLWTIAGGVVDKNGTPAGSSSNVALLLYDNNIIYQETNTGSWSSWNGSTWVASSDPRVVVNPINGACGASNGLSLTSAPTGGLCSTGAASAVTGSGPWTWSCGGSNSGTTASCSAKLTVVASSTASPSGTTIPSATYITDANANVWSICATPGGPPISQGAACVNQQYASASAGVNTILYYKGQIYIGTIYGSWWSWTNSAWVMLPGGDPRGATAGSGGTGGGGTGGGTGGGGTTGGASGVLVGDTNRPNNSTFVLGEPVTLTFTSVGDSSSTLNLSIVDEHGNSVASATVPVTNGVATYSAPSSKLGYYRVNASLGDGATMSMLGTRPAGFITYAVVPDPSTRVNYGDALSHFGMEGGFAAAQGAIIPYLGLRYMLSSAGGWTLLEPNGPGQFAAGYAAAKASGQVYPAQSPVMNAVVYNGTPWPTFSVPEITTASLPSWAGPLGGTAGTLCNQFGALNAAGVAGLPGFASALASEVAADYATQTAHYYQVTWEPESPWCYGGSPAQLVQYYQLVYSALHDADPKALVMGPTIFPGDDAYQTAGLYAAGLGNYLDAFSIHPYVNFPPETSGLATTIRTEMSTAATHVGHSIPFGATEYGFTSGSIGELNEALGDVRETIILIGEGFKFAITFYPADFWNSSPTETGNTFGYYWNLDPNIDWGTDKIGPKPAVPAYAAMTYLLDGTTTEGPVANLSGTQVGYRFQRNGTTVLALWDYQSAASSVNLPTPAETVQICDWMGNCTNTASSGNLNVTLGAAPVYIIGKNL